MSLGPKGRFKLVTSTSWGVIPIRFYTYVNQNNEKILYFVGLILDTKMYNSCTHIWLNHWTHPPHPGTISMIRKTLINKLCPICQLLKKKIISWFVFHFLVHLKDQNPNSNTNPTNSQILLQLCYNPILLLGKQQ